MQLLELSISDFHQALRDSRLSAAELVSFYLERIARLDGKLRSVICVNPNALAQGQKLDESFKENGYWAGPLHGVPVLVKDNIETAEMPTTGGSLSLEGFESGRDAPIISRLRAAGAIILAKTNLHEFAIWGETISSIKGQTLNPYDLNRTPGGSSGGTGAAVAANFGMVGLGTDTVNSIRSPASACNLFGLRPSMGSVSRTGIIPYSLRQDTAGPITRTAADLALVQSVIAGFEPLDAVTAWGQLLRSRKEPGGSLDIKDVRLGVLRGFFGSGEESAEVNRIVKTALEGIGRAGAKLVELDLPFSSQHILERTSVHLHEFQEHLNAYLMESGAPVASLEAIIESGKYSPSIHENLLKARNLSTRSTDYQEMIFRQEGLRQWLAELYAAYELDALVFPHQQVPVCPVGGAQSLRNGVLASVTGFPSLCVPVGFTEPSSSAPLGIPVGMELLGYPFNEPILISIAEEIEQEFQPRKAPLEQGWL